MGEQTITQAILARSMPPAELVEGDGHNIVVCSNLEEVGLHPSGQPYLTDPSEREVARIDAFLSGAILVPASGDPDEQIVSLEVFDGAGILVFTDRRVVLAFGAGELLSVRFKHGDGSQRAMMFSIHYRDTRTLSLMRKPRTFGGVKDAGIAIWLGPALIRMEPVAETALTGQRKNITDIASLFRSLVEVVADFHIAEATDADRIAEFRAVRGGAFVPGQGGRLNAVFIPDNADDTTAPPAP